MHHAAGRPSPPLTWSAADEQALQRLAERKNAFEREHVKRLEALVEGLISSFRFNSVKDIALVLRGNAQELYEALAPFVQQP